MARHYFRLPLYEPISKEEYEDYIRVNPEIFIWKSYDDYATNSKDGALVRLPHADVEKIKEEIKIDFRKRGRSAYDEMLRTCLEHPVAGSIIAMLEGSRKLLYLLNLIVFFNRILLLLGIVFLFIKLLAGVGILIFWFILSNMQTQLNFELAARRIAVDRAFYYKAIKKGKKIL